MTLQLIPDSRLSSAVKAFHNALSARASLKPTNKRGHAVQDALIAHISFDIASQVADALAVPDVVPQIDFPFGDSEKEKPSKKS